MTRRTKTTIYKSNPRESAASDAFERFDDLLLKLYRGVAGLDPWSCFLEDLRETLGGSAVTLLLRPPAHGDRGQLFDVNTVAPIVEVFRSRDFDDNPFLKLQEGAPASIFDLVPEDIFHTSKFYRELLALDGTADILGLDLNFGNGYVGGLRISRRGDAPRFGVLEKAYLTRLYPHLQTALEIYDRSSRSHIESNAYVRAMDQLAFGVVILNDRGDIVHHNGTIARLTDTGMPLKIEERRLRGVAKADDAALNAAITKILTQSSAKEPEDEWLTLSPKTARTPMHVLLKPIFGDEAQPIGVALYITLYERSLSMAVEAGTKLFGLSSAEAALLSLLIGGATVLSASIALGISEATARTQLQSIFVKTGTHRQPDLVRMVLTSLAMIA